jgi:NitT/TauT family transport system ATP-binding protein
MHLEFRRVSKSFRVKRVTVIALKDIDIHVETGELVCIVGASGSGKSTLLRMAAGLEFPTSGTITVDNDEIIGPGPDRGMVFQSYTLYPWMTVRKNVAFGLRLQGISKWVARGRVEEYLKVVGLSDFANALPNELSGGMKQRVAIARALICQPKVLLMDEPFGALDVQTKEAMQRFLLSIWKQTGTSILLITHDVTEAVFLAQRVYVLTRQPGTVLDEVSINLEDKHTPDIRLQPAFLQYQYEISNMIRATLDTDGRTTAQMAKL